MSKVLEKIFSEGGHSEQFEKLDELLSVKLNAKCPEGIPLEYSEMELTRIELNFLTISEAERGFSMSGSVVPAIQDLSEAAEDKLAERWEEVGMAPTARVMKVIGKILRLEGVIYRAKLELELHSSLWTPLNDIRKDIEGFAIADWEYEKYLVEYVKANQSDFCEGVEFGE